MADFVYQPAEEKENPAAGRPLSRQTLQRERTLEAQLQASFMPRWMERLREIEDEYRVQRARLARAYAYARREHGHDPDEFEREWLGIARRWRFDEVNELVETHNRWYPAEAGLPLDPRTGEYVTLGGRPWRRELLDESWILERFPAR